MGGQLTGSFNNQTNRKIKSARGPLRGHTPEQMTARQQKQVVREGAIGLQKVIVKGVNPVIQDAYISGIIGPQTKKGGSAMSRRQHFQAPLLINRVQSAQGGPRAMKKLMKI